jgi:predicted O-linked N-acetylglucosamine transferase (SPINDLY family)
VALCPELVYTNDAVDAMYNLLHKGVEEDEEERRPPPQKKKKTKKVRVGIVSSKLYNHETLKLHGGLLEYLARDESELDVTMACWGTVADEATKRAQKFLTYEKSLNLKSLSQVVSATANSEKVEAYQSLEAEQFDVILFMDLPLDAKSFSLAHRRIAPVQVAVWGHHT